MTQWDKDSKGPFSRPYGEATEEQIFLPIYAEINDLLLRRQDNKEGKSFTKVQFFYLLCMRLFFGINRVIWKARYELDSMTANSKNHGCLDIVAKYGQGDGKKGHFYFGRSEQWDYFSLNQWSLVRHCLEEREDVYVFQDFEKMEESEIVVDLDSQLMAATEENFSELFGTEHRYLAVGHKLIRDLSSQEDLTYLLAYIFHSFYHFVWSGDSYRGEWVEQINSGLGFSVEEPLPLFWAGLWIPEEFCNKEYTYFEEPAWEGMMSLICENNEDLCDQQKPWKGNCNLYFMDIKAYRDKSFLETLFLTSGVDLLSRYLEVARSYWPDESAS